MPFSHPCASGLKASLRDIGAARDWMTAIAGPHSLSVSAEHPLAFEHAASRLGPLSTVIGRIHYGTEVVIGVEAREGFASYSISLPLDGEQEIRQGRQVHGSDTQTGIIVCPREQQRLTIAADCRKLQVVIPCQSMQQVLEHLLQQPVEAPVHFDARVDAEQGATAGWWRMVRYLADELEQASPITSQLLLARDLESSLIKGLLLSQPNNYSAALAQVGEPRCPAYVGRAREFIERNAQNELTLMEIQAVAGVSPQRLHEGFKRRFGVSPLGYLKRLRLNGVRRDLLEERGVYTVAATATRWGFTHLGRFASDYQQAFGEQPSQSLARGKASFTS